MAEAQVQLEEQKDIGRQLRIMQKAERLSSASQENDEPYMDEEELDDFSDMDEADSARMLASDKREDAKEAEEKIKKELEEKIKKKVTETAAKAGFNSVSTGAAATLIGIIVTWILWTIQFIGGNWLKSKIIPALGTVRLILWGALSFIIIFLLIFVFILAIIGFVILNGWLIAATYFGTEIISFIKNFLGL